MYYPKSQIKTNLYTNGGEFVLAGTLTPYLGYYHSISTGRFFSGKTPQDKPVREIERVSSPNTPPPNASKNQGVVTVEISPLVEEYLVSKKQTKNQLKSLLLPSYYHPSPTDDDYKYGVFTRYFVKKGNEGIYIEINKDTFNAITDNDPSYDTSNYIPFKLDWTITGESKQTVAGINFKIASLIERNSLLTLNQQLPGLTKYFKDYSQFYIA